MADIVESVVPPGSGHTPGGVVYGSMAAAEAGGQASYGNLVGDGNTYTLECYSGEISEPLYTWVGWTTSPTNNITIKAAEGQEHKGVQGDGFRSYKLNIEAGGNCCWINQNNIVIQDITFGTDYTGANYALQISASNIFIQRLILLKEAANGAALYFNAQNTQGEARNCLVVSTSRGIQGPDSTNWNWQFNSCTVIGITGNANFGFRFAQNSEINNCAVYGHSTQSINNTPASVSYNATQYSDATGPGSITGIGAGVFADYAGGDYSVAAGQALDGAGSSSGFGYTDDITGGIRTEPWDIGSYALTLEPPVSEGTNIFLGDTEVQSVFLGSTPITSAWLGSLKIFGPGSLPPPVEPPPELNPLTYEYLMEGTTTGLSPSGPNPLVVYSGDSRQGSKCMQCRLTRDLPNTLRVEGVQPGAAFHMDMDTDYWIGGSLKLVGPWQVEPGSAFEICFQIHDAQGGTQPPIAFYMGAGYWRLRTGSQIIDSYDIQQDVDRWLDYVIYYYPSETNGRCTIWFDGVQMTDFTGRTATLYQGNGPYLKWGIYKGILEGVVEVREVRHDSIRIIRGPNGKYEDVDPRSYD